MTASQQRSILYNQIWKIADEVRGAVDGWDFKQYILGALFYRFISEDFADFIDKDRGEGQDPYHEMSKDDKIITAAFKHYMIITKGYFIDPDDLFVNVIKCEGKLNTKLEGVFKKIEKSYGQSKGAKNYIEGLFDDFDITSKRLGKTVDDKSKRLRKILEGIKELNFQFEDNKIDLFGDAYEFLISKYAANAGKSGGEFFTPQSVSKLLVKLAIHNQQTSLKTIYDPACGSGSLLLQVKKEFGDSIFKGSEFFGQEINTTTYNLARMNMFLHGVNYDKFHIYNGDTLAKHNPKLKDYQRKFDVIVSNPPYSLNWEGDSNPDISNDERFSKAGAMAPKSKADFAFVMDALYHLGNRGRAAIVCFPGIFYRGGAEQKIRQYLVDDNYIEAVISLAPNLFYGTSIATNILVLSRNKGDTSVQFIDASGEEFFEKETNNNVMHDEHINRIIKIFVDKKPVAHVAESVSRNKIKDNDYNLSVSSYVEPKDTREVIDISKVHSEIKTTVGKIDQLRTDIDAIVTEVEA
ncbi:type I restriction-modification system, M subunit [Elysia marginata]|uniref:site-specific DNA-methyltransferase (adenine-specific) n=1 Tax=Elysia marginata TaxID=1093978 RepID=A0AAV4FQX2_9GAST|nr:type I restriction-modification system, M subunit [Elysia marginata]